jgi:predicted nucleic acid-binding protein
MAPGKPRPFLDTNVLFSGLYRAGGPPATILERHAQGRLAAVISRQVLEELVSTIRAKKPDLLLLLQTFLTNAPPEVCADPLPAEVRRVSAFINATDAPILAAAIKCGADCLVTGNTRHFTAQVARQANLAIFTPAAYLAHVDSAPR